MHNNVLKGVLCLFVVITWSCQERKEDTLFRLIAPETSGITFSNTIDENDTLNILTREYIYNGGAVAIGDFNNDGLSDIFFSGNSVGNRLYINKGNLQFEDITETAGLSTQDKWSQGVALADINNDGWLDIYVCATFLDDSAKRANMLFVNQGLSNGKPTFREKAQQYGIADTGYSTHAAFLDYDKDGDLDLYVLTNILNTKIPTVYRNKITDGSALNNDRFYRNNSDGTFTNVTKEAGIVYEGYGLGVAIADFNKDSWPDIYVSNDYLSNDLLYINQGDGTFKNQIRESIKHQSMFSMGNDAADFNNDGWTDIVTLDMLGETNYRQKTTLGSKTYLTYINNEKFGYEYQYIRNMLQVNNGLNSSTPSFSEIGLMAGIYQTDWSWSPLFADFDNDGNKDLVVSNGFPKDVTDRDFSIFRSEVSRVANTKFLLDSIPEAKVANYVFRNNGDLTFADVTRDWGMTQSSFSNGAAFADLDNDGDLDYVVNNIDDVAFLYENTLYSDTKKERSSNFLRVRLEGMNDGLGAKITLKYDSGKSQYHDHSIYRGYLSTVENVIHFGLGDASIVDTLQVEWPDGSVQFLEQVKANQVLTVTYKKGGLGGTVTKEVALLELVSANQSIAFRHEEGDIIDFNTQRTLPHKFSQAGPGMAVGDVNSDGLEDLYIGGSAKTEGSLFLQEKNGRFHKTQSGLKAPKEEEEQGVLLFDADNDNDLDLLAVSGSIEYDPSSEKYRDKLYTNNGKGVFTYDPDALPDLRTSGSCVRAADFDKDGDLDLFIGGRVIPGSYPMPAQSFILRNEKGKFEDVTGSVCPELDSIGLIIDGLWTDFDSDGQTDLILAGEFMPLTFFRNDGTRLTKLQSTGVEKYTGWWNSLTSGDFDQDGDIDYVAGNLGRNNYFHCTEAEPLKIFAKDFDKNGSVDPILACYFKESAERDGKKLYPLHFWDELYSQSPKFRQQFVNYKHYARTDIEGLLSKEDLKDALILEANHMETSYIENLGNNKFSLRMLPVPAQTAPVNGMVTSDIDGDGNLDVLMVGNDYGNEVFAGRYDAFTGLLLRGDGKGGFDAVPSTESGFYVDGDAKALTRLTGPQRDLYIASQNRNSLKVFRVNKPVRVSVFRPEPMDAWAELVYGDGRVERVEFYYGSGYLSQSSRSIRIPASVKEITVYDTKGNSRKVAPRVDM